MRVTLLDWLVKLTDEMNLGSGTYALTIHLIDLALSREVGVKRSQFQLLGCACLLIASKLEEVAATAGRGFGLSLRLLLR